MKLNSCLNGNTFNKSTLLSHYLNCRLALFEQA